MPFAYDGFGNLTQQGQTSLSVEPTTNRINSAGYQYNANGNVTQTPGPVSYSYDVANRLVSNGAIYNPRNQRVFDGAYIYLYTPDGKQAGKYQPAWGQNGSQAWIQGQPNVYFAGKLIQEQGQWVMTDRLGSVRLRASGERSSYQPYGAEVAPATSDQRTKFATYYRDSAGLDYAGQRYYSNAMGRFLTPDPGGIRTADPKEPGSWNRYAYVGGDPVNFRDPQGLFRCLNCDDEDQDQPILGPNYFGTNSRAATQKGTYPPPVTPSLGGSASPSQKKLFTKAARATESKLGKSDSPCAGDFGPDALKTFDRATYTLGVSFATDDNGNPTAAPDRNIYATTNPGTGTVTINMVGYFFDISPTPIPGTDYKAGHDMGTGLSQTDFDAFVLLHELGHLTGVLGDDTGKNQPLADAFNAKILNDCFGIAGWKPPQ